MSGDIEPIPEGFLARLLGAYGLQWTHLAILSGVVFSSFALEKYLNPGVWVLGVVSAFGLVLLFEPYISPSFPLVAALSLLVVALLLGCADLILHLSHRSVPRFVEHHSPSATLYIAWSTAGPVGCAVLSYRKRPDVMLFPLPAALAESTQSAIMRASFINETVDYNFELLNAVHPELGDRQVILRYELTFNVWNRSRSDQLYADLFDPAGSHKRFYYAAVNREVRDHDAPELRSELGLRLEHRAAPGERFQVVVRAESTFGVPGSELIGSYLPSNNMVIRIHQPPPGISIFTQSLASTPLDKNILPTGDVIITATKAVLPYQGIRLFWDADGRPPERSLGREKVHVGVI